MTALFNSSWYSGSILAAWATFATFRTLDGSIWSWRFVLSLSPSLRSSRIYSIPTILQGIPSVLQIALIWFVPESPRWLVAQGRVSVSSETTSCANCVTRMPKRLQSSENIMLQAMRGPRLLSLLTLKSGRPSRSRRRSPPKLLTFPCS